MKLQDNTIQGNAISTQVKQDQMSTKTNVNQKQMSTETNVNQKQMSTETKCHIEVT